MPYDWIAQRMQIFIPHHYLDKIQEFKNIKNPKDLDEVCQKMGLLDCNMLTKMADEPFFQLEN